MADTKSERRPSKPTPPQPVWSFDHDAGLRKEMRLAQVRVSAPGVHTRGNTSPTLWKCEVRDLGMGEEYDLPLLLVMKATFRHGGLPHPAQWVV
jgi:hypothetical protein